MEQNDNLKYERRFIYLLLHHKDLVSEWIDSSLSINKFSEKHKIILTCVLECYDKGVILTRNAFQSFIQKIKTPKEKIEIELNFNKCLMSKVDRNDFPFLIDAIIESYLHRVIKKGVKKLSTNIKEYGPITAINEIIDTFQNSIEDIDTQDKIIYEDFRSFSKDRIQYIADVRSGDIIEPARVLCGINEIDETMGIGFAEGTLTLFCADSGGFKSFMMLNVGLNIWQKGYNVLFVPIEMAHHQMYTRAWARQARVNSNKIIDPKSLTEEEIDRLKIAHAEWDKYDNKFFVLQMPASTTVSSIKRQIEKYISVFSPKVVIVDYIDNMDPDKDRNGRHDMEISDMLQGLRKAGQNIGFAVVSGAQLGREALKRIRKAGSSKDQTAINSEDIRGAQTFVTDADTVYAQLLNPSQPSELLDLYVVKSRHGKKFFNNGSLKATLEVTPEYGLIKSQSDYDIPEDEDVVRKMFDDIEENASEEEFNNISNSGDNNIEKDDSWLD